MVTYHDGYELWRHKQQVIEPFFSKKAYFFSFFQLQK